MNKRMFFIVALCLLSYSNEVTAQTYTTESKKCGSCGKPVSANSRVGMTCPHCGVRWGYENTSTKRTNVPASYDYNSYKTSGYTSVNANLRSAPSTNASVIIEVPAYTSVTINSKTGDWYFVKVSVYNGYYYKEYKGYIHKKLIK